MCRTRIKKKNCPRRLFSACPRKILKQNQYAHNELLQYLLDSNADIFVPMKICLEIAWTVQSDMKPKLCSRHPQ